MGYCAGVDYYAVDGGLSFENGVGAGDVGSGIGCLCDDGEYCGIGLCGWVVGYLVRPAIAYF